MIIQEDILEFLKNQTKFTVDQAAEEPTVEVHLII